MSGLMMASKDSKFVDRAEAFRTDILPVKTKTYQPVKNSELIEMVHKIADEHSLVLIDECLGMAGKNSQQFFATYVVEGKDFFDDQIKMMLGVVNSYDKTLTAKILFGQIVQICSNKSFYAGGENGIKAKFSRKHTNGIFSEGDGLYYKLNKSFEMIDDFCREQEKFCEKLREHSLTKEQACATIIESARAEVIGKTDILAIANLWKNQTENYRNANSEENESGMLINGEFYDWYGEFHSKDCYSLFNCYTSYNRERITRNPVMANLDTLKLTEFFNKEFVLN